MKKFILGLLIGAVLMFGASKVWFLLPISLGGMGRFSLEPSPFEECKNLDKKVKDLGSIEVAVLSSGKPVPKDLEVDLGPSKDRALVGDSKKEIDYLCPQKTNEKGVAVFENIPVGEVKVFFNFAFFPKELGNPGTMVEAEVKKGEVGRVTIELKK